MKKLLVFYLFFLGFGILYAQEIGPITVVKEQISLDKTYEINRGFAKGDLIIFSYKSIDGKNFKSLDITGYYGLKKIFSSDDKPVNGVFQYQMPSEGVVKFTFTGFDLRTRDIDIEIKRIPISEEWINFDTRIIEQTITEEIEMVYQKSEQIEIKDSIIEHKFKMFDKYIMQEVPIWDETFQLKSIITYKQSYKTKKISLPKPPVPDAKLYKVSYYFNSVIGGSKHWDIVKVATPLTVGIASSFLLTPAGGAAIGAGTEMMLDAMGPNPAGEPTTMLLVDGSDMKKFNAANGDKDKINKLINEGSGDSFGAMMTSLYSSQRFLGKSENIVLQNIDVAKAKNIKANVTATYYAPLYKQVIAKERIFTPVLKNYDVSEKFKVSINRVVPLGLKEDKDGTEYVLVQYLDTVWSVISEEQTNADIVNLVPRIQRVKSQETCKSEIIYNQAFAAPATNAFAVKIRLPEPINDDYQYMKYNKLKYTITVGDATYQALKGQIANVVEAGVSFGIGFGVGKIAGKLGSTKIPEDESMNTVEKILDVKDQYDQSTEIIESSKDVKDIYENGSKEEEEEEEAFFIKNGEKANTVLKKVGADNDTDVTEYIPDALLKLKIPSVADISENAADFVTPKIKDKIHIRITPNNNSEKIIKEATTGFLVDSITLTDNSDFNILIENPRADYDYRNFLSMYMFGTIMVEVEYEQTNYKDMVYFDEIRTPTSKSKQPKQKYEVVTRIKYIPKSEIKPYHKILNQ